MPLNRQPVNEIAPWGVVTDDGQYVGVQNGGLYATQAMIGKVVFSDGSTMRSAGSGLPPTIDVGTF